MIEGAAKPQSEPSELTNAIPAGALLPLRYVAGIAQQTMIAPLNPNAAPPNRAKDRGREVERVERDSIAAPNKMLMQ